MVVRRKPTDRSATTATKASWAAEAFHFPPHFPSYDPVDTPPKPTARNNSFTHGTAGLKAQQKHRQQEFEGRGTARSPADPERHWKRRKRLFCSQAWVCASIINHQHHHHQSKRTLLPHAQASVRAHQASIQATAQIKSNKSVEFQSNRRHKLFAL